MRFLNKILLINLLLISSLSFLQEMEYSQGIYNFVENGGQWPERVHYRAAVEGGNIWLEKRGILFQFNQIPDHHGHQELIGGKRNESKLRLIYAEFVGANIEAETSHQYPTRSYYNFFKGQDKSRWVQGMKGYNHIFYQDLYPGVDLRFWEENQSMKYEFKVAPGSDPSQIAVKYHWMDKLYLTKSGNLVAETDLGEVEEQRPFVYQIKNGKIVEVSSAFVLDKESQTVTYELGDYDEDLELVIDPFLVFATYNGAESDNFGMTATYGYDGTAYAAGMLYGSNYPITGPSWNSTPNITLLNASASAATGAGGTYGIADVFLSKFSADGNDLLWTNILGGGDNNIGTETCHSLICDTSNNIYLYGVTSSVDFPLENEFQSTHQGGSALSYSSNAFTADAQGTDIYVSKFSADGLTLMGSTYIGGSDNDGVSYLPSSGGYSSPTHFDSLTYNYGDQFRGEIMLDSLNNIIVASCTRSTDFPTESPFQPVIGGFQDGVVFKINADFSSGMEWSSYFGGSQNDACYSVKLDSSFNFIVGGGTSSTDLPGTIGGLNPTYQGGSADGFICKLSPDGLVIDQSTYIGTASYDQVFFVEVDRWDNVYMVGQSEGAMPVTAGVWSEANGKQFIQKINPELTGIEYSTVFGQGNDVPDLSPSAFLVDVCGNVYVSGWGSELFEVDPLMNDMYTTSDAFQDSSPNGHDFYLIVFEREAVDVLYASYMGGDDSNEHVDGGTSRFDKYGIVYQSVCGGCGANSDFPTGAASGVEWSGINESGNCNNLVFKFDFEIVPVAKFSVDTLEGCAPLTINITNNTIDLDSFQWIFPPGVTVITGGEDPTIEILEPGNYEIILEITDTICNLTDTAKQILQVYPPLELEVPDDTIICGDPGAMTFTANSFGTATEIIWGTDLSFSPPLNTPGVDSSITITPTGAITYYVMATNGFSYCDLLDSVQVIFVDGAIQLQADTTICWGTEPDLTVWNNLPAGIGVNYDWEPDEFILGPDNESTVTINNTSSGWFYVTATTSLGCVVEDSVFVTVTGFDPTTVSATADPIAVPINGTTTLTAMPPGHSYSWTPVEGVANPTSQITDAVVTQTTEYEVTITDGICNYKGKVIVEALEFVCGDVYVYVPNAFTPDGNNENDMLFVLGQNIEEMEWKIFDRWGEKVFESNDQSVGWDGLFRDKPVDPDVYMYHLKVTCAGGDENLIKGNITVIR